MILKKLFSKLIVCVMGITLGAGAFAAPGVADVPAIDAPIVAETSAATAEMPGADGANDNADEPLNWATEENRTALIGNLSNDLQVFEHDANKQLVADYVPIEAKIGMAFMNAMGMVGRVLEISLVRFMMIFIIIMYAFWIAFEAYQIINGSANAQKTVESIVKKGGMILIWAIVLNFGAAQLFMWIMGPIISVATYISDLILNAMASYVGADLPDTCAAIHQYAAAHTATGSIIDAGAAADLMCVPTRLSGFFYTGVAVGFKWMLAGLGFNAFSFLMGTLFIILFIMCIWKFAVIALGVIADLFLGIFMLPFTALTETIGTTSYKGIAGDLFNGFAKLLAGESLSAQIGRFVKAAIYFVSLSIVVAVCMAMMSGVITIELGSQAPSITNSGFVVTLMVGMLVWYLADRAESIAKDLGGAIDASLGNKIKEDAIKLGKAAYKNYKSVRDLIKESKSSSGSGGSGGGSSSGGGTTTP